MARLEKEKCDQLVELCDKYLSGISFVEKLRAAIGGTCYCSAVLDRAEIHEKICEILGKEHSDRAILEITNNLDKHIGFDIDADYNSVDIRELAIKLTKKLLEVSL